MNLTASKQRTAVGSSPDERLKTSQ